MPAEFPRNPTEFCITDVGSTTTKALLFRQEDTWRFYRREAPTTVEEPHADVTVGVTRALQALEAETGTTLLRDGVPAIPYLSTSSAGGGLAMVVTGLVRRVTSRSAERVALGAGAILLDVVAMDDGRTPYEKIEALKTQRPDMVLLAGGFDGEAISGPVFLAELVREAGLRPKLSPTAELPVLYAGNAHASDFVRDTLGRGFMFHPVANLRPAADRENLDPAREAIHDLFMDHVMSQAPGYEKLISWVSAPIVPTPSAFGKILAHASRELGVRILAIDIGGATTDVFTAHGGEVHRTVSANLGMSYSLLNVAHTAGIEALGELLASEGLDARNLWDRIGSKHIAPTSLPDSVTQMRVEWAAGAVAIREAVKAHLSVLEGVSLSRTTEDLKIRRTFGSGDGPAASSHPKADGFKLKGYDLVIGSGGILSHSPRGAAGMMLVQALRPAKPVDLAVDSAFVFPHLGVLSDLCPELAVQLFQELGMVRLGRSNEEHRAPASPEIPDPGSRVTSPEVSGIARGEIRLRRELAVPGEVMVSPGQEVEANTRIARSVRHFLRPFFLDVARALQVEPGDVRPYLKKREGDEVKNGEVLANRKVNVLRTKTYISPVNGTFERLLPDGTMVVRELPEEATSLSTASVARDLRMHPEQIDPYLRVEEGQPVERGQWVAALVKPGDMRISRSPVRGKVKEINRGYGIVTIEPLLEELDVLAWLPGTVVDVSDRGGVVASHGTRMEGVWGTGGEVSGRLSFTEEGAGTILVKDTATADDLSRLDAEGASGLIAGGLHLKDVLDLDPALTIVVTEGFGPQTLSADMRHALQAHEGRLTLLDGTTELRVGVRRPRIILPDAAPANP